MSSYFEKNIYLPSEQVNGFVHIDNSQSQVDVTQVEFNVEQVIRLHHGGYSHTEKNTLVKQTCQGPKAGEADWKQQMSLNLMDIKYEVAETKNKKGKVKKISPEDHFSMAGCQPACHAEAFESNYYLCVKVNYDIGCSCGDPYPDSQMSLCIVPLINPACFGFQPPATGWAPMHLGHKDFNI